MDDKDLQAQFEGVFSGITPEPSEGPAEHDTTLEELIATLLEGAPVPAGPPAGEPAAPEEAITAEALVAELVAPPVTEEATPLAEAVVTEPVVPPVSEELAPAVPPAAVPVTAPPLQPRAAAEKPEVAPSAIPAWNVQIRRQRIRILNVLLSVTAGVATLIVATLVFFSLRQPDLWQGYVPYFAAWVVLVALALARRLDPRWRIGILVGLTYLAGTLSLVIDGPLSAGGLYLLLAPLLFSILVQPRAGLYAAGASLVIYVTAAVAHRLGWLQPAGVLDPRQWETVLNLSATFGMLLVATTLIQWLFTSTLLTALREAEERHADAVQSQALLRERADELFAANALLQKRTLQLEMTAQVSGTAALSAMDPDALIQQAVNLIHEQRGLYYVGLFLTDEAGEWAMLRAGTGEAGRQMVAHNYGVAVSPDSIVGRCIASAQAIMPTEVETDTLLPDTHSQLVLPLRSRGRVIGALDLRDTQPNAFSEDDVPVLQTMADQIAVAIENARLFARTQESLRELEKAQRGYLRERWAGFIPTRATPLYERARPGVMPLGDAAPPEVEQAMTQRKIIVRSSTDGGQEHAALVAPILLRGEVIGVLGLHDTQNGRQWTADEIALVQAVADQMSLAIENARLLEETRQRAERERLIAEITTRVRASIDMDGIMQAAVRELGAALGADRVFLRLSTPRPSKG